MTARSVLIAAVLSLSQAAFAAEAPLGLSLEDAVKEATAHNSSVRAAKAQYEAALRQVLPAYSPQDPQIGLQDVQTPNGLTYAQEKSTVLSESFQFPGKSWLQGSQARRSAEIARLSYEASVRDARTQVKIAYYQTLLDSASASIALENALSFGEVLRVVQVAYSASQAAQSDLINAELGVTQSSQTLWAAQVAEANDEAALNQIMQRPPETPLTLTGRMDLKPLDWTLDFAKEKALAARQEVLQAALAEKNSRAALKLAAMELLPDLSVSWARNGYPPGSIDSVKPAAAFHDYSTALTFNVPLFAWFRQKEDIRAAADLLEESRQNRAGVELQTGASIVELYRSTQLAYKNARLYEDLLVPLAARNFRVALIAYQSKKVDYLTLASALQNIYNTRIGYLTDTNQFLAGRTALEQIMGAAFQ